MSSQDRFAASIPEGLSLGGVARALLLPPLTYSAFILLAWVVHVWEAKLPSFSWLVLPLSFYGGLLLSLTIAFRTMRRMQGSRTGILYMVLALVVLIVVGFSVYCFLWSMSDGSCL
jgi:hypothetical protein